MYQPKINREDDLTKLQALMQRYAFATMVTSVDGSPFASHLPFLLDADRGAYGTLRAHMARANPQWQQFENAEEILVIFQGPHAYISPRWYENHPSVPTWNYAVVHAYGKPRLLDEDGTRQSVSELVEYFEGGQDLPEIFDLPTEYLGKMVKAIVGFEIEITRLEGKFKLSQNRSQNERENIIAMLAQSALESDCETAELMQTIETSGRVA